MTEQTTTPAHDLNQRWAQEIDAARKALAKWHEQGDKIDKRFRDERDGQENAEKRLNLFTSNVQTQRAMLLGGAPKVSVGRRFADADDDVARVAAEILERLLNTDIERDDDSFATALRNATDDRLLPGLGNARVRYVVEFGPEEVTKAILDEQTGAELAPEVKKTPKVREDVEVDYIHWKDQLWSPARVWSEVRWWAHCALMTRQALVERFGQDVGSRVPLDAKKGAKTDDADAQKDDPRDRARVWEVWSKEDRKVFWYVEGHGVIDQKDDPLGLTGFWPCPSPMLANVTTSSIVPRPDYALHQDLYVEIDNLSTRIGLLQDAIRVAGVYDKSNAEVKRLLSESKKNDLYPIDNWAAFAENGGVRGVIDWLPLDQIVAAIATLTERRREEIDLLFQTTGMSDLMRGQAASAGASATEQAIKARFGSVRIQALQDDVARFATELQRKKAEIIAAKFDAATIAARCNCERTPDAAVAPAAIELLKSRMSEYRVEVKSEALAMQDFAALKQESMEVLGGLSTFLQAAAPLAQAMPSAMPFLLQMLQWAFSRIRGASSIEGVLDKAIQAAEQAASQPQQAAAPDPKVIVAQMKGAQDLAKVRAELEADITRTQVEVQADNQREQNQAQWNVREAAQKAQISQATRAMRPKGPGGVP